MLVELGAMEQRHAAVLEVLRDGAEVKEVALRFGVTRQTVHRWLRRYAARTPDEPGQRRTGAPVLSDGGRGHLGV